MAAGAAVVLVATRSCIFSPCRKYRYVLRIQWAEGPAINYCMLNPSTADEVQNDPTVERCERRARAWGYGAAVITNIFAYRATDPREMRAQADPVGPNNDWHIRLQAEQAARVICAWGGHGKHMKRSAAVRRLLAGIPLYALKVGKNGECHHPLYLPYKLEPIPYENAR